MESALLQKMFLTRMFPFIASQCSRVSKHCDHRQLIVERITSEQETRSSLCSQTQVNNPNLTSIWTRHRVAPFYPAPGKQGRRRSLPIPNLRALPPIRKP